MATGDRKAIRTRLTASVTERFGAPVAQRTAFARRTWFTVTLVAVLGIHLALLVLLLRRDRETSPAVQVAETPVEVIVQPPPQPAPKPAQPAPAQPPEKPASSAPRAANDDTVDHHRNDPETHAPKADRAEARSESTTAQPTPPEQPQQESAKTEAAAQSDAPSSESPAAPAEAAHDVPAKDAEAMVAAAPPEPPRRPAELAKAAKASRTPPSKPERRPLSALQQLAGASNLPDYTFAKPMRRHAKVTGGTEDDRYLAVVYGMITQDHALGALPDGDWLVSVTFQVDGDGNLVGAGIQRSSGYPQVDLAALQAVERAAPFPPPPSGAMTGLIARLHSAGGRAAALSDEDR